MSSSFIPSTQEGTKEYQSRYKILYIIIAISSVVLISRLWYLQILQGQLLREYSEKNRVKETKIPAPRGFMLSRDGEVLVQNLPGFSVSISPQYATKLKETAEAVGQVLEMDKDKVIGIVKESKRRNGPFRPAIIKDNITLDEVFRLRLIRYNHPGLKIDQTIVRHYPMGENGSQLFGYVGEISKSQLNRFNNQQSEFRFEQGDIIGKSGLEEIWDSEIRGEDGISFVEVDARGREAKSASPSFLGLQENQALSGQNLVLTIDADIQKAGFEAMAKLDKLGSPRRGSLIAINDVGEVLAWISTPSFDPNEFSTRISSELWSRLINDPFKPLHNKVIKDHYAPGSTFKPIVALAALQEDIIDSETLIHAPGFIKFGRRIYHDHTRHGHGKINVAQALERSSNVFFYRMGISLGIDKIHEYAGAFGIGSLTGIKLKNEVPGLMPNSAWKKRNYGEDWQPGENLSNAIGQGFVLTTALQMALAYNAIGTEGKLYKPMLVKKLLDNNNRVKKEFEPELLRDLSEPYENFKGIKKEHFKTVKEGLRLVVNGKHGTARGKKIRWVEMAGKTGTSQVRSFSADQIYEKCNERNLEERHHGWFVGYAPADNPKITVAVLAEHSCSGSSGGAPVVKDVVMAYMDKYHPEYKEAYKNRKKQAKR